MDFFLFIKSFEVLAAKLYPERTLNDAFFKLYTNKIQPILPEKHIINSDEIQIAIEKVNQPKIKDFLIKFAPVILPHYSIYCDKNNNMRFCNFFEFYKNYCLFPDLVSLVQLKNIFFTLSETNNGLISKGTDNYTISGTINTQRSTGREGSNQNNDTISFSLFVESLAITSILGVSSSK